MDHPSRPEPPSPPEGVELRGVQAGEEDETLAMFEAAFMDFEDRQPSSLATWRSMTFQREGFVPEDLVVAVHEGEIVGGAFLIDSDEIWVDKLAVRRGQRRHGIARSLLQTAFVRSFERGYTHTSLSTDSNTGALTLYERVGMRVVESFTHHAIDL